MVNILVVEDDREINSLLCDILKQKGFHTISAFSGDEAFHLIKSKKLDLILLDLMIPGISGEELLPKVREVTKMPMIIISAKSETTLKVEMLREGADDYITKPFNNEEVLARVESALRRSGEWNEKNPILSYKNLVLNTNEKTVAANGKIIIFTAKEYSILETLFRNTKRVFSKEQLFESIWHEPYVYDDNTINTHISNIRKKLKCVCPDDDYIETVWGLGYKLAE